MVIILLCTAISVMSVILDLVVITLLFLSSRLYWYRLIVWVNLFCLQSIVVLSLLILITLTLDLSRSTFFIGHSLVFPELITANSVILDSKLSLLFPCDYEFAQIFLIGSVELDCFTWLV